MRQKIITTLLSLLMLCSFAVVHVDAQEAEKTTPPALAAGFPTARQNWAMAAGILFLLMGKLAPLP